jgi:hypothetical protein
MGFVFNFIAFKISHILNLITKYDAPKFHLNITCCIFRTIINISIHLSNQTQLKTRTPLLKCNPMREIIKTALHRHH